jgi:hypothetical protein
MVVTMMEAVWSSEMSATSQLLHGASTHKQVQHLYLGYRTVLNLSKEDTRTVVLPELLFILIFKMDRHFLLKIKVQKNEHLTES